MNFLREIIASAVLFLPSLAALAVAIAILMFLNWFLRKRWEGSPDGHFRFQLIMLALTFAGGLSVIVTLPVSDA